MDAFKILVDTLAHNTIIQLVVIAVVMDTLFGAGRALKQHKFNSSVGIDGAIRKISMLVSLVFLAVIDRLVHINLIGFIPEEARAYFPQSISTIGLAEFFGLLYLCYEVVSILKNMALCGLPVKKLWEAVRKFLGKYTEELPDTEEQDAREEQQKIIAVATDNIPEGALEENTDGTVKVFNAEGQVVGNMAKEAADALAANASEIKIEQ
jgi:toxin secretion/phage lysis holin